MNISLDAELEESKKWNAAFECFKSDSANFSSDFMADIATAAALSIPSCSFVQFLSKCLKIDRGHAHPERDIGKVMTPDPALPLAATKVIGSAVSTGKGDILYMAATLAPKLLKQASSLQGYYVYFLLILLKDVVKDLRKTTELEPFILQIAPSLHLLTNHLNYGPVVVKLLDLLVVVVDSATLGTCSMEYKIAIYDATIDVASVMLESLNPTDIDSSKNDTEQQEEDINFIRRCAPVGSQAYAATFFPIMKILNGVAAMQLYPEVISERLHISELAALGRKLNEILIRIFTAHHIDALLHPFTENDPSMLDVLLLTIEAHLRLDIITETDGKGASSSESCGGEVFKSLLHTMLANKLEPIQMFVWFVRDALCSDAAVLIDLLCGSETMALKYILRIVKYFKSNPGRLEVYIGGYDEINVVEIFFRELHGNLFKFHQKNMLPFNGQSLCDSIHTLLSTSPCFQTNAPAAFKKLKSKK